MLSTTNWHTDLLNNLNNSYLNDIDKLNICKGIYHTNYNDKYVFG